MATRSINQPVNIPADLARETAPNVIQNQATNAAAAAAAAQVSAGAASSGVVAVQAGTHGYPNRDVLSWPCMSGEPFAPVGGSYGQRQGRPALVLPNSSGDVVAWPAVPRVSPADPTKQTLQFDFLIALSDPAPAVDVAWFYGSTPGVELRFVVSSGRWQLKVNNGSTDQSTLLPVQTSPEIGGAWVEVGIDLHGAGAPLRRDGSAATPSTVSCYLDNGLAATSTHLWNALVATSSLTPGLRASGGVPGLDKLFISGIEARWRT